MSDEDLSVLDFLSLKDYSNCISQVPSYSLSNQHQKPKKFSTLSSTEFLKQRTPASGYDLIYDIFSIQTPNESYLVFTCQGQSIYIYEVDPNEKNPEKVKFLQENFLNNQESKKEDILYTIDGAWLPMTSEKEEELVIAAAGYFGFLYILVFGESESVKTIRAHTNEVFQVKFFPKTIEDKRIKNLLVTASKDGSIAIWDVAKQIKIIWFGGVDTPKIDIFCIVRLTLSIKMV